MIKGCAGAARILKASAPDVTRSLPWLRDRLVV
jgi:hypothetical protein